MDTASLTIESLNTAMAAFHAAHGSAFPVGVAMSPRTKAMLYRQMPVTGATSMFDSLGGVPLLIDPRMTSEKSEAYYDREAWHARCKEQREWDAAGSGRETQNAELCRESASRSAVTGSHSND